ncbi:MAG: HIT family protein [Desulfurococcales archaeon]|nr:HIT family protein [Desulfurococcales archaeon]
MARECIFCRIAKGEAPAYKVYEDEVSLVFLDIFPVEKGHLLVTSREHYEAVHNAPPRVVAHVFTVAAALAKIYRDILGAPGVNIVTNSGRAAGQEVFHFHVHVIPRWRGGGWRRLVERHVLTEEEAREVLGMLKPHIGIVRKALIDAGLVGGE